MYILELQMFQSVLSATFTCQSTVHVMLNPTAVVAAAALLIITLTRHGVKHFLPRAKFSITMLFWVLEVLFLSLEQLHQ